MCCCQQIIIDLSPDVSVKLCDHITYYSCKKGRLVLQWLEIQRQLLSFPVIFHYLWFEFVPWKEMSNWNDKQVYIKHWKACIEVQKKSWLVWPSVYVSNHFVLFKVANWKPVSLWADYQSIPEQSRPVTLKVNLESYFLAKNLFKLDIKQSFSCTCSHMWSLSCAWLVVKLFYVHLI